MSRGITRQTESFLQSSSWERGTEIGKGKAVEPESERNICMSFIWIRNFSMSTLTGMCSESILG